MTNQNHDIMIMIYIMIYHDHDIMMYHDIRDFASALAVRHSAGEVGDHDPHHRNPQRGFQVSNIMIMIS